MKKIGKSATKIALFALIAINLTACGGGTKFLDTVDVSVNNHDQQTYVQLSSTFNLGDVSLAEASIPILDPKTEQELGQINFYNLANGQGKITLEANASLLLNADSDLALTLPNGRPIPKALNIGAGQAVAVPILEHSRVYLGGDLKGEIFAGVALGLKGLDQVMDRLEVPANVFFILNASPQLLAVGGVYASPNPNQNGVAIFGKYSAKGQSTRANSFSDDNELDRLDYQTQKDLIRFFHGEKRVLEFH